VKISNLSIRYGTLDAVRDVSFDVAPGQVVGLVGPNGAGKTSIVETVGGLRNATVAGTVSVFGHDPRRDHKAVSRLVGIQMQDALFPSRARVSELCDLYEAIYNAPGSTGRLLKTFGISDRRQSMISSLSGGMQQRLALVLAQLGKVRLVILDELTSGLDPEQRRETWRAVLDLAERGVAVLLTSHYMDEVEALCSRVGVLREGRLIALGSPDWITAKCGGPSTLSVDVTGSDRQLAQQLRQLGLVQLASPSSARLEFEGSFPEDYNRIVALVTAAGRPASIVGHRSPTFEDAYLRLTQGPTSGGLR